jgi:hypothetical protein
MLVLGLLFASLLATACSRNETAPPSAAPAPGGAEAPAAATGANPAPTAAPTPAPTEPGTPALGLQNDGTFLHRGSPAPGRINFPDLRFFGWSDDGRYFAYSVRRDPDATSCGIQHRIYVIDADLDAFVPGGDATVAHESAEPADGVCRPADLDALADREAEDLMKAHGVRRGHLKSPVRFGENAVPASPKPLAVRFDVRHRALDIYSACQGGAGYRLVATWPDGSETVIETGLRRRRCVVDYSLGDGLVFASPDGSHAAFVVVREETAFEGVAASFMANGIAVPAGVTIGG